jgi:hypothetical protein
MTTFAFEDYVRATMGGAKNAADGSPLTQAQVDKVASYLKSPGSGPDATTSYEAYVARQMAAHPPELPRGMDYVGFSGTDSAGNSNFKNAVQYTKENGHSGIIGDTPWGKFIDQSRSDPEFGAIETKFRRFLTDEGIKPYGGNYQGALQDMMWNAGSSPYLSNAVHSGRPVAAFVENAPLNRGFSTFELPTALNSPSTVMNGYPMSAFGSDPLTFASKSAAEFQQLETHLAQSASVNGNHAVSVADIRAKVDVLGGYDAVNKTLFGRPLDNFSKLDLAQMTATSRAWSAEQAKVLSHPSGEREVVEPKAPAIEPHPPTGPPRSNAAIPIEGERAVLPESLAVSETAAARGALSTSGVQVAGKVLGVGGVALMGYDAYKTTEQYQALSARGNNFGADALLHQYEGRTAGGVVGSIGAGMAYGFFAGSESGPGALLTGAAGGVVGAFAGDKIATAYNEHKVNHQTGTDGVTYAYANGNWTAAHANVDWSHPTPDGFPGVALSKTQAPAAQLPTLDYKRTTAATELALANPSTQDTKTIKLDNIEWHASREGWTKEVQETYPGLPQADEFGRPFTVSEKADAKTGAQLDQIAANRQYNNAHYTEAVSQAYVMDYYGKGWNKVGPLPDAITHELKLPSETHIKDPATGFTWTADGKGQFSRNETTVGYDTPVTQTVKASGEELARVSKLQQEAVQSNAAYGSQLIAQKYQQLEAPTQQQAPVQPTPASHPGQAASTTDPTKTAQTPVAGHSPEFQALSAKLQRISAAMESGDTASLRKEAEPYVNSPQGQSISAQAKANVQREEPSREQQRDPRDAGHPDYALNKDIRTQVESLYTRSGVYPTDKMLDHVTAAVALNAREQGITHVDELRFNADKSAVIAMQNPSNQDMFSKSSSTNIQQAMQTPPEHAYQQMAQVTQQQAQTQQNIQQQIAQSQQSQQPQQGPSLG